MVKGTGVKVYTSPALAVRRITDINLRELRNPQSSGLRFSALLKAFSFELKFINHVQYDPISYQDKSFSLYYL